MVGIRDEPTPERRAKDKAKRKVSWPKVPTKLQLRQQLMLVIPGKRMKRRKKLTSLMTSSTIWMMDLYAMRKSIRTMMEYLSLSMSLSHRVLLAQQCRRVQMGRL